MKRFACLIVLCLSCLTVYGQSSDTPLNFIRVDNPTQPVDNISQVRSLPDLSRSSSYSFIDGLGRQIQSVNVMASPLGADLVTFVDYDMRHRQVREYLSFPHSISAGASRFRASAPSLQSSYYTSPTQGVASAVDAFSETEYEASGLDRALSSFAPGQQWAKNRESRPARTSYLFNSVNEIRNILFDATSTIVSTSTYSEGQLTLVRSTDENGNWREEYKNSRGNVIVRRFEVSSTSSGSPVVKSNIVWAETYYVYDLFDRLRLVIQPEGVRGLKQNGWAFTSDILYAWCFIYNYDGYGRVIEQRVPGAVGSTFSVYNSADQVVLVQDANQSGRNEWSYTKYDGINRPIQSGLVTDNRSQSQLQLVVDADRNFPTTGLTILSETFYDDYDYDNNGTVDAAFYVEPDLQGAIPWSIAQGQVTGTKTRILGTNTFLLSSSWYAEESRVLQIQSDNHVGGRDIVSTRYNYPGWALSVTRRHTSTSQNLVVRDDNTYDHTGRLLTVSRSLNGGTPTQVAAYSYNELGQLITKNLGRTSTNSYLQSVDLRYNVRGWLTKINDHENMGTDLYAQLLTYGGDGGAYGWQTPRYNGDITTMTWRFAGQPEFHTYNLNYDGLSRLRDAWYADRRYYDHLSPNRFNENISYDLNGNISSLHRAEQAVNVDALYYAYEGNRLTNVRDFATTNGTGDFRDNGQTGTGTEFTYDANGNLTADLNKGLSSITYNHLNLPLRISFNTGQWLDYQYDASGTLRKRTTSAGAVTDYVGGLQYESGVLQFFPHAEGRVFRSGGGTWEYEYHIKDHLGNLRVAFQDIDRNGSPEVVQRNSYYPFGKSIDLLDFSGAGPAYQYQYNGKEKQTFAGLGWYDYGARMYDPVLARWSVVDKLAAAPEQVDKSPYAYGWNNPTNLIDPDGNCPLCLTALVGAAIGATAGAVIEAGSQILSSGSVTNWNAVGGAAVQGGVAGAFVGLTAGVGAAAETVVGAAALGNAAGGLGRDIVTGQQSTPMSVATDAATGAVGQMATVGAQAGAKAIAGKLTSGTPAAVGNAESQALTRTAPSLKDQAAALVPKNGGQNRVSVETGNGRINYDLAGKPHGGVATPHKQSFTRHQNPGNPSKSSITRDSRTVETMTQGDIRVVKRVLKERGN